MGNFIVLDDKASKIHVDQEAILEVNVGLEKECQGCNKKFEGMDYSFCSNCGEKFSL